MKVLAIALLLILPISCFASEEFGKVYFGKNLAKPYSEHTNRLKIQINDSDKFLFNARYSGPVISNLDLNQSHMVKVLFDGVIVQSWILSFKKLNTNSVIIWRSAGSWRIESTKTNN